MSLIWGVADIVNVAMPTFTVLGAYSVFWMTSMKINPILVLAVNVGIFFFLGVAVHGGLVVSRRMTEPLSILLLFYGLSIALENIMLLEWGPDYRTMTTSYSNLSITIVGGYRLPDVLLISFVLSVAVFPILEVFLRRTRLGRAIRASGEDKLAATLMGIDVQRTDMVSSGISAVLAFSAGIILVQLYPFYPTMDIFWLSLILPIVVLGGTGSLLGTLVGGLAIGELQAFTSTYLQSTWLNAITFGVLLIVLVVRPSGLLGRPMK